MYSYTVFAVMAVLIIFRSCVLSHCTPLALFNFQDTLNRKSLSYDYRLYAFRLRSVLYIAHYSKYFLFVNTFLHFFLFFFEYKNVLKTERENWPKIGFYVGNIFSHHAHKNRHGENIRPTQQKPGYVL